MIDIVFPDNNEKEFIEIARRLGYSELIFAYAKTPPRSDYSGIKIRTAILAEPNKVQSTRKNADFVVVQASATEKDRFLFEKARPDFIFGLELGKNPDSIHQRNSGLNNVLAKLAYDNGITIAFSFSSILNSSGFQRAQILGRMMQNIALCRKHKVKTEIFSFAKSPRQMRAHYDMRALFSLIGMR